ncbi:Glycosyltransferase, catalytic subunit of cellulose synthase and poly-beta-1,6-N-acetylglucosamine synthase [Gracilibacillus ureilyticus]|uniref:Glycosyltransferase, catalytic subunit of cellulose synthase and poly-beta-1,6-N-acetylglucosamine synthase n=1 Tax=Gracilibacillus ureilyticus TaxID=531814 RepID=A0A1H9P7E3_9BACI|nr:glycosyltransferase [Gracilibacillus ureilyticus]SER44118.1 Glycosyltransferase, catalytic subunit of cellulose synthase and poly-beta-1,6-N-acetylglucosamine synthase [Gracilibacillus ureilyticus]
MVNPSAIINYILLFFASFIFLYMILVIVSYGTMLLYALRHLRKDYHLDQEKEDHDLVELQFARPVSVIVPAYNEELGIIESIHSLLSLKYPQYEIIVVNDGSTDRTMEKLLNYFQMEKTEKVFKKQIDTKPVEGIYQSKIHPDLLLIDKVNGGKADALNIGINASRYPYICSLDADSILENSALIRVMKPLLTSNGKVIAAGGSVKVANGNDIQLGSLMSVSLSDKILVVMQVIEYFRAFLMGRLALSKMNLSLIISGAFSVFEKKHVISVGGYDTTAIGEDIELVIKLQKYVKDSGGKQEIQFVPTPVCWTEAPESLHSIRKQRRRWHQGLLESLWKYRQMTFNPRYGIIGIVSLPYFWIVECLGPIIEVIGYIFVLGSFFTGSIYVEFSLLLSLLFILYGSIFSFTSVIFEAWNTRTYPSIRDLFRLILLSFTEVFWYRPLTLIWRIEGIFHFLTQKHDWGHLERKGLANKEGNT